MYVMMKFFIVSWFCAIFCISTHCLAQSKCALIEDGSITAQTYTNKALGLSYTFPGMLKSSTDTLPRNSTGRVLLTLWNSSHNFEKPSVVIFVDDPSQYQDTSALGYAHRIENTTKHYAPPANVLQTTREFAVSGLRFYRVDYQFTGPDKLLATAITGQIKGCEISLEFTAVNEAEMALYLQSIQNVKFASK